MGTSYVKDVLVASEPNSAAVEVMRYALKHLDFPLEINASLVSSIGHGGLHQVLHAGYFDTSRKPQFDLMVLGHPFNEWIHDLFPGVRERLDTSVELRPTDEALTMLAANVLFPIRSQKRLLGAHNTWPMAFNLDMQTSGYERKELEGKHAVIIGENSASARGIAHVLKNWYYMRVSLANFWGRGIPEMDIPGTDKIPARDVRLLVHTSSQGHAPMHLGSSGLTGLIKPEERKVLFEETRPDLVECIYLPVRTATMNECLGYGLKVHDGVGAVAFRMLGCLYRLGVPISSITTDAQARLEYIAGVREVIKEKEAKGAPAAMAI